MGKRHAEQVPNISQNGGESAVRGLNKSRDTRSMAKCWPCVQREADPEATGDEASEKVPPVEPIDESMSYEKRLFLYTTNEGQSEPKFVLFRGLQRLNILRLQNELARIRKKAWQQGCAPSTMTPRTDGKVQSQQRYWPPAACHCSDKNGEATEAEILTTLMHQYTDAVRDYEYWSRLVPLTGSQAKTTRLDLEQAFYGEIGDLTSDSGGHCTFKDLNLLSSDPLRDILKRKLPLDLSYTQRERTTRFEEYSQKEPPEYVSPPVDRLARFIVAVLGGASLVVPMLIMRLPSVTLVKSLVTTSLSVLLFAAALSVGFRASNTETLVSTATYAAVLVVFVGTSS